MINYADRGYLRFGKPTAGQRFVGAYVQIAVLAFTLFLLAPFLRG